ncbi:MAG: hypothetical protein IKD05_00505 [Tidjanibacter sp.]|nr:hypothetical protein [Tidjanibacter sp.]MBR3682359.1 hypothetical protein [Tidjanibacter sp.]MBR3853139.1 hypothetical protein [Tidjanibacter sp.]MBR7128738.1 hypothetical protein [Tidjanibacter sp.]
MMTPTNGPLARALKQTIGRLNGPDGNTEEVVDFLLRESLLDATHLKSWVVRREVDQLVAEGAGRIDAMETVAEEFGMSFYTVRKYIYGRYK